jgi:hypothetical protein
MNKQGGLDLEVVLILAVWAMVIFILFSGIKP